MTQHTTFRAASHPRQTLGAMVLAVTANKQIIYQLTNREIVGRYKGSIFGLAWSLFNPILMLLVYTLVFSEIFKSRWPSLEGTASKTEFALTLFVGLIVLNLFSEVINKAPTLVLNNVNYVKKVVFPLEILPIVSLAAALFHCLISLGVLLLAFLIFNGYIHGTAIFLPLILLPFLMFTIGLGWILASLGVFLRDVGQTIGSVTTVLMFLSPVFYPLSAVPEGYRPIVKANPLTFIIEQSRDVLIWGKGPDWIGLSVYLGFGLLAAWIGFAWFQSTRSGFADVL
jgi:lipopolysaccharide transport system permease protein